MSWLVERAAAALKRAAPAGERSATSDQAAEGDGGEPEPSAQDAHAADPVARLHAEESVAFLLSSAGSCEKSYTLENLADRNRRRELERDLPGRILVVDARLGGLDADGLLSAKVETPPPTLDGPPDAPSGWNELRLQEIGFRVARCRYDADPSPGWRIAARWFCDPVSAETAEDRSNLLALRVESWPPNPSASSDPAIAVRQQSLHEHLRDIGRCADDIAERVRLPDPYRRMLRAAAVAHDFGKARDAWQRFAHNPGFARDPIAHPALAKFVGRGDPRLLEIGGQTYRHEFGSLRDAQNQETVRRLPDDLRENAIAKLEDEELRELALHLIVSHHGFARPVIAAIDPAAPPSACAELAREAALRFARLQARWGVWGLAWWEALLRAADWAASRALNDSAEQS